MTDVADNAQVEVSITGLPFPAGVSLDDGPTVTPGGIQLPGVKAKDVKERLLEHPQVSEENIRLRVLDEGTADSGSDLLAEAVGEQTAADIREQVEGVETLAGAKDADNEDLTAVSGVGPKTLEKIREA